VDNVYFDLDDSASEDNSSDKSNTTTPTTPKCHPHLVACLLPSASTTPQIQCTAQELFPSLPLFAHVLLDPTNMLTVSTVAPMGNSIELLASLQQLFHTVEQALYMRL
jgi:hypothetical protein